MNNVTRIVLTVAVSAAAAATAPFLLITWLPAANNLAWQLSYLLPGWAAGLAGILLVAVGVAISAGLLALVITMIWRKR